jgi:hypothetical protein
VLRFTKNQKETLIKLKELNVKVPKFVRDAIKEKLQREYKELVVKEKKIEIPF